LATDLVGIAQFFFRWEHIPRLEEARLQQVQEIHVHLLVEGDEAIFIHRIDAEVFNASMPEIHSFSYTIGIVVVLAA
jgi:hypothetical protein